jgi:hypothetical protein
MDKYEKLDKLNVMIDNLLELKGEAKREFVLAYLKDCPMSVISRVVGDIQLEWVNKKERLFPHK